MPRAIRDFTFGCLLAAAVLAGMVLFQYVGERAAERFASPRTIQAGN